MIKMQIVFGNFGIAMTTLGNKRWFMENVDTWLYFYSEDSEDPDDFVIEDFKEMCLKYYYPLGAVFDVNSVCLVL